MASSSLKKYFSWTVLIAFTIPTISGAAARPDHEAKLKGSAESLSQRKQESLSALIENFKAIDDLTERRTAIIKSLGPLFQQRAKGLAQLSCAPGRSQYAIDDLSYCNFTDFFQELVFLYLARDIAHFTTVAEDQDTQYFLLSLKGQLERYIEDDWAAEALRFLGFIYSRPLSSAWIYSQLAPLAEEVIQQTIMIRPVEMAMAQFPLPRLFSDLEIWTHHQSIIANNLNKRLELKVEVDSRGDKHFTVRIKQTLASRCVSLLRGVKASVKKR